MSAPFRIHGPRPDRGLSMATRESDAEKYDQYLTRLLKLIPSEVITLYLVGRGLIPANEAMPLLIWTVISLIGVVVVRAATTAGGGHRTQWPAVLIASISFVVWIYSLGDVFEAYDLHVPYMGSLLVLSWTFFIPYVYRGSAK